MWKECWQVEDDGKLKDTGKPDAQKMSFSGENEVTVDGNITTGDPMEGRRIPGSFDW